MEKLKVTIIGAGGKMGLRVTNNLMSTGYKVSHLEVSQEGIERLNAVGVNASSPEDAIPISDIVIFAVPDIFIKKVTAEYVPMMKPGALGITLDPAAPLAGGLAKRDDIAYVAIHPSHPSVFNWEPNEKNHRDYFGGISARQAIVCALIQGEEKHYEIGEEIGKIMFAPVTVAHRITLKQMGILEPALSETFLGAVVTKMKEAVDIVVEKGVPKEAAFDFFLGHVNIEMALLFGQHPGGQFSDAAKKAIKIGEKLIFKDTWKEIFEEGSVEEQIKAIT